MGNQITKVKDNLFYDERSAGGLVYKIENGKVLWLLIKTINGTKKAGQKSIFKFPKGHLQRSEFLKQAALREVEEEGQVKASIVSKIGSNNYIIWDKLGKKKIIKKVTFFLMEYERQSSLKHYDTEMVLDREWLSYEEACEKLAYDSEKVLLKRARMKLEELVKK